MGILHRLMAAVFILSRASVSARANLCIYESDALNNSVDTIPIGGGAITTFATGFTTPEGIACTTSGTVYVANLQGGMIFSITPMGGVAPFVQLPGQPTVFALTTDTAGDVYASLATTGTIDKITPAGTVSTYATGLGNPRGLAFDASGDLLVADYNGHLDEVAPGGGVARQIGSAISPWSITTDSQGDLYFTNGLLVNSNTIVKYSPQGRAIVKSSG